MAQTKDYDEFVAALWKPPADAVVTEIAEAMYSAMCMAGEAGEVCDCLKKVIKGTKDKEDLALEIGDTLYYLTNLAHLLGLSLSDIIEKNKAKLNQRRKNA